MDQVPQQSGELQVYLDSLRLGRDVMNLMLRGRSVIDNHQGLPIRTLEATDEFLHKYGSNNPFGNCIAHDCLFSLSIYGLQG